MIGWLLLIIPAVIVLVTVSMKIIADRQESKYNALKYEIRKTAQYPKFLKFANSVEGFIITMMIVCTFIFIILCTGVGIEQIGSISFVKKYEAISAEYDNRADSFNSLERIALFKSAAEMTGEAAVLQYWNKYFDPFITDDVNNLKPMR